MCGIYGIYNLNKAPVTKEVLCNMMRSISHRGPDAEDSYISNDVGLGHRRLIAGDTQPKYNKDKTIVVVHNGAIYNHIELRDELRSLGHRFTTLSDTEVIVHAYEEWGRDCLLRFNGMWAIAIWDDKRKELFISRDRLGEKPLYYALSDNTFLFASEIKSILSYGLEREENMEILEIYLFLGYIPAPFTSYKNIHKLLPGHYLIVRDGAVDMHKYWDLPEIDEDNMVSGKKEVYEQFEHLLTDSVRLRMRSDVPYGVFLSGGLDSASIVALMSKDSNIGVNTFTAGFDCTEFDERPFARKVAEKFKTEHNEIVLSAKKFDKLLDEITCCYDEPFGDSSAIGLGCLAKYAKQKVKIVLTGDGGDEVLSGYTIYQGEKFAQTYNNLAGPLRYLIPKALSGATTLLRGSPRYKIDRLANVCRLSCLDFNNRLIGKNAWAKPTLISFLTENFREVIKIEDFISNFFKDCSYRNNFYRLMYFHFKLSLPGDMLTKVDRMSMAHSLEARTPFLDYRLVEFMIKVDKGLKMPGYKRKAILRETIGERLPRSVLRGPKRGFVLPLREWFKDDTFKEKLNGLKSLASFGFNPKTLNELIDYSLAGTRDHGNFIWMLFILNKWFKNTKEPTLR